MGYEKQEAVISANYVNDSKDANAIELSIKVKQNAGVLEALKRAGVTDYTVDLSTHTIKILGFDLDNTEELEEQFSKIKQELGSNYDGYEYNGIQSRYIDKEVRQNIRNTWSKREQNRQLHSYLTQAEANEVIAKEASAELQTSQQPVQETQSSSAKSPALAVDVNELQLKASAVLGSPQVTLVMRT